MDDMSIVALTEMRDLMLPGLQAMRTSYNFTKEQWAASILNNAKLFVPAKPYIWIPKLTIPEAVAVGAAAAIIKNPIVTRRFWQGWLQ